LTLTPDARGRKSQRVGLPHAKTAGLAAQNRGAHENFTARLGGMIAYLAMVNPQQGCPLQVQFAALREREDRPT
jgi:hypothetical protein